MLSDATYNFIFRQPRHKGLTELGRAAVEEMYKRSILIDLSHMRADAMNETFELLDKLDRERGADPEEYPVVATHAGYRFGKQDYMLDAATIEAIRRRNGVIGLIMARHQLQDGLRDGEGLDHTVSTMRAHIDRIQELTGSHDHVGIGSDLDGFIKPTMSAIEYAQDLGKLEGPLREAYPEDADKILSGNAHRAVRKVLKARAAYAH
jgi:microsomal dipeptidase-like Zn-dependent dipeptidase